MEIRSSVTVPLVKGGRLVAYYPEERVTIVILHNSQSAERFERAMFAIGNQLAHRRGTD
jgi:hypothetical protein